MRNPFAKSLTTGQWLLSSLCWTLVCGGGWLLFAVGLLNVFGINDNLLVGLLYVGAVVAHALIWNRAVASGYVPLLKSNSSLLETLADLWLHLLVLAQVLGILMLLIALSLIVNPNSGSGSWW